MALKRSKRVVAAINTYTLSCVGCYVRNYGAVSLNRKIQSTVGGIVRASRRGPSHEVIRVPNWYLARSDASALCPTSSWQLHLAANLLGLYTVLKSAVHTSQRTQPVYIIKTSRLALFRAMIGVCCENSCRGGLPAVR